MHASSAIKMNFTKESFRTQRRKSKTKQLRRFALVARRMNTTCQCLDIKKKKQNSRQISHQDYMKKNSKREAQFKEDLERSIIG